MGVLKCEYNDGSTPSPPTPPQFLEIEGLRGGYFLFFFDGSSTKFEEIRSYYWQIIRLLSLLSLQERLCRQHPTLCLHKATLFLAIGQRVAQFASGVAQMW